MIDPKLRSAWISTLTLALVVAATGCAEGVDTDDGQTSPAETKVAALSEDRPVIRTRADAIRVMNEITVHMTTLDGLEAKMVADFENLGALAAHLDVAATRLGQAAQVVTDPAPADGQPSPVDALGALRAATLHMQETQMSFNQQYLQLQINMQRENRLYTSVSNIMKTKHDTVKNSISNVR